ncbi:Anti-sigma-K factor rskA [Roseivivax jejudonensis]|uniref:Anti-sigma-K factor rskA n=1 Tax=Roseivivax jejudonensis TaxID=1529041 RepID=A0A1X6ZBX9_9RHOB|nr:anti-sigma factor [Roseivivax jejudonensis]SLN47175.1 Anti-sigma-K factor rskA [Roseivivax jejudonensis]
MTGPGDTDMPAGGGGGGEDSALAAEYVLGLMPEAEATAFETRLAAEPALEQEVVAWTEYLAMLADGVEDEVPATAVKRRIEAAAFGPDARSARTPFWRALVPYGLGAVAAALLAWVAFTFGPLGPEGDTPLLVADIAVEDQPLAIHAGWFEEAGELLVIREAGNVPADSDLELWVIAGEGPPVSLGLVPEETDRIRYTLPQAVASLLPDATLAVSQEPPGGSTTGAPTGPILGTAPITYY